MANTNVVVPGPGDRMYPAFMHHTVVTAGNTVTFVDAAGNEVNMGALNVTTSGTVKHRGIGYSDAQAVQCYYGLGGWHNVPFSRIYGDDTTATHIIARAL